MAAMSTSTSLDNMSKEELVTLCRRLMQQGDQAAPSHHPQHQQQQAQQQEQQEAVQLQHLPKKLKKKKARPMDFSRYQQRYVALQFAYVGINYAGLAIQQSAPETIEAYLFDALKRTRLIEARDKCKFARCGRTDKGVSAARQVVSLYVRSKLDAEALDKERQARAEGQSAWTSVGSGGELPYVRMLNRCLPKDIRVLAWTPLDDDEFSARFSCKLRTYKYYFVRGDMDIERMRDAASKLVGEHDYRNFCKPDVSGGVLNYKRRIVSFTVEPSSADEISDRHLDAAGQSFGTVPDRDRLYEFTIVGTAFLWHQVRCMVAVLFMVGKGDEAPEIVDHLLDVEATPRKPNYVMASEVPLVLHDCAYENLPWIYDLDEMARLEEDFASMWRDMAVRKAIVGSFTKIVRRECILPKEAHAAISEPTRWCDAPEGVSGFKQPKHIRLMDRGTSDSIEERVATLEAKRRASSAASGEDLQEQDNEAPSAKRVKEAEE